MSSFDKYYIRPAVTTDVKHRLEECIPYYNAFYSEEFGGWSLSGATLPIFVSPMSCIIDENNYNVFDSNGVIPIIPRTVDFEKRKELLMKSVWIAVGLEEMDWIFNNYERFDEEVFVCVDIANGHMASMLELCKNAKEKFGHNLTLMAGNIAHPNTYYEYAKAGIDYCRCTIGDGQACLTNTLTGIGQDTPKFIQSLARRKKILIQTFDEEKKYISIPQIVIDGGMSSVRDIIIALALGADYVMCGKIFAKCSEACGPIIPKVKEVVMEYTDWICPSDEHDEDFTPFKVIRERVDDRLINGRMYYGMSTKRAQIEMGKIKLKHDEGKQEWISIDYSLPEWIGQFEAAICSTMSYCNTTQLGQFIGKVSVFKYED